MTTMLVTNGTLPKVLEKRHLANPTYVSVNPNKQVFDEVWSAQVEQRYRAI